MNTKFDDWVFEDEEKKEGVKTESKAQEKSMESNTKWPDSCFVLILKE